MLRSAVLLTLRIVFWCRAARFAVLRPAPTRRCASLDGPADEGGRRSSCEVVVASVSTEAIISLRYVISYLHVASCLASCSLLAAVVARDRAKRSSTSHRRTGYPVPSTGHRTAYRST